MSSFFDKKIGRKSRYLKPLHTYCVAAIADRGMYQFLATSEVTQTIDLLSQHPGVIYVAAFERRAK
jgi:hypothetical protein